MPGIAIQPGFALAGMPASRKAPPATDDRFSRALHESANAAAQDGGKTNHAAADNSHGVDKTGPRDDDGGDDKVGQPVRGKDDRADEEGEGKDNNDKGGNALPPHMMAERTLAGQWSGADQPVATKDGPAAASAQTGGPDTAAPAVGGAQAAPSAGAKAALQPGAFPAQGLPVEPPARARMDGGTGTVQVRPAEAHPVPDSVSVTASTAADAGKSGPLAAVTAKIVAARRQDGGSSPVGPATTPAADAKADMAAKILQTAAGQGSGNTDAGTDGQGDGPPGKTAQNAAQLSPGVRGDTASAPLPTAQMVPSSGGAASFAGALQQGGALARYAAAAAAALAAGTSASALPAQSLSIQLRPVELGAVTAHLKYAGGGLSIDIQVETPEAHRRLSSDSSDIVKSLQSLGFQVDKVTVRQALAQSQGQGQAMAHDGAHEGAHDGSSGGYASGGGSPFSTSGQSGGNGHRQGSESGYEDGSERGVAMVRETADRVPRRGVFI